jgi:flagellar hook-associated protein FlgK
MLDDVESIFHETDGSGLSADLNNLFQSYENFRSNPDSNIYKNEVINHSEQFVLTIKELKDSVTSRAEVTKNTLKDHTKSINNIILQAHTIKSNAASIGALKMRKIAYEIEQKAKAKECNNLSEKISILEKQFDKVQKFLKKKQ